MPPKKRERNNTTESLSKTIIQRMPDKHIPTLVTVMADLASHDDRIRHTARRTLTAMGRDAVPSLVEALTDKKYLVRWEAAKALGEIGDANAASALVAALEDDVFDVRWLAAVALIQINIRGLRPLLQALVERGDSSLLREGAHHVIHDLSKGGLRKYLFPVLSALEDAEASMEVPLAAFRAIEKLAKEMGL